MTGGSGTGDSPILVMLSVGRTSARRSRNGNDGPNSTKGRPCTYSPEQRADRCGGRPLTQRAQRQA